MFYYLAILSLLFISVQCDIYRLPKNVRPTRYVLTMEPDLDVEQDFYEPVPYKGSIVMELEILENTRYITFHKMMFDIDNSSITIVNSGEAEIKLGATTEDEKTETYTIQLEEELVKDEHYKLTIGNFFGHLRDGEGFFLVTYYVDYSNYRVAAVTHFEPTGARTAFPCFDEPALKAKFIVNLIRREGYHSLSNEELETTEDLGNGRFKDTFKETPKMSTYIVAFAISDFVSTEKVERHRIFTRPQMQDNEKKNQSMKLAVKALKALEEYTGIDFILNKVDHFAVPDGTFKESAMENWGLIVYTESYLFSTRDNYYKSPEADNKRITICIAHEFVHQWFGNLVTPDWWDYIWLSESLAAYFQYYIASTIQPSRMLMDQYVIDVVHKALRAEETQGAYPLNYPLKQSERYPPFYIMYEKGGSIIRMMAHALTHDVFRRGLQIYLENRKFSTAVPTDLYSALQKAVDDAKVQSLLNDLTVAEIMQTWDTNEGFPLVTVTRDYKSGSIKIVQEPKSVKWTIKENWKIPINYIFSSDSKKNFSKTTADFWLTNKSATINNNFPTDGWLLINKQQTGYYRVNYDLENWERIIQFLNSDNFKAIHVLNRVQLIDDAFSLAHDKRIPSDIPLRLCEYLIREKNYVPWAAFPVKVSKYMPIYYDRNSKQGYQYEFFNAFARRNNLNSSLDEYDVFQEYIRSVTSGIRVHLNAHNASEDSYFENLIRYQLNNYFPLYFGEQLKIYYV